MVLDQRLMLIKVLLGLKKAIYDEFGNLIRKVKIEMKRNLLITKPMENRNL